MEKYRDTIVALLLIFLFIDIEFLLTLAYDRGYTKNDYSCKPNKALCEILFDKEDYLKKNNNNIYRQHCKFKYFKENIKKIKKD